MKSRDKWCERTRINKLLFIFSYSILLTTLFSARKVILTTEWSKVMDKQSSEFKTLIFDLANGSLDLEHFPVEESKCEK